MDPVPLPEFYGGDETEDIGDTENESQIGNDPIVADSNRSDGTVDDIAADYEDGEQDIQEPQLRRSVRIPKPQTKYPTTEYVLLTDGGEPESYEEAIMDDNKGEWLKAMQEEMQSLHEN